MVGVVEPSLQRSEIERSRRKHPENLTAYDLYLRAVPHAMLITAPGAETAVPFLEDALKLDPNYAAAHALLAFCRQTSFLHAGFAEADKLSAVRHARAAVSSGTGRRQVLHRRAAEVLRAEPERAAAEPELVAHHFTEAGLDDLAIEWWGKAGEQALRRSAFQEAIAHLGKAIAMADKGGAASRTAAGDAAASSQRLKLQTDYGQAVMYSKGFAAEETKAAFARATELAASTGDFSERFAAAHGRWTLAHVRGELKSARELASALLREAEGLGRIVEVGVASRGLAIISYSLGEFAEARTHCERALAACGPERDREARERFSEDTGLTAMSWLAVTMWQLGEVERARELVEVANRRAVADPPLDETLEAGRCCPQVPD